MICDWFPCCTARERRKSNDSVCVPEFNPLPVADAAAQTCGMHAAALVLLEDIREGLRLGAWLAFVFEAQGTQEVEVAYNKIFIRIHFILS